MTCPAPRRNNRGMPPSSERVVTPRQAEVLAFVVTYSDKHGYSPATADLCAHFGWKSTNACQDMLTRLQDMHLLTRAPKVIRSLVVTESGREAVAEWRREQEGQP
ncbi:SOS-response repressor and protease [Myxococcus phage Mx9]|nr:Orf5 [Myxococcus phage Mx9]WFG54154.1 SOS-response repressor and protease [Myxococcus phage Mx9]